MKYLPISKTLLLIMLIFIVSGCGTTDPNGNSASISAADQNADNNQVDENNTIVNNADTNSNSEPPVEESTDLAPLAPEPQLVEVLIPDGRVLEGLYYPANINPAPVIVLFHMAGGSRVDFGTIALWLQNRNQPIPEGFRPYLDSTWFPAMPKDATFSVFVITFGGYGGYPGGDWTDFPLEALTTLQTVSLLDGVDPNQITTMGASVGADSAASSCYQFNQLAAEGNAEGKCQGSFSLSPGNYLLGGDHLTETYKEVIAGQQNFSNAVTIFCLASENDGNTAETCLSAQQDGVMNYSTFIFSGRDHGLNLFKKDIFPTQPEIKLNTLEIYLQFLNTVYNLEISSQ